jgi:hypothetical protein
MLNISMVRICYPFQTRGCTKRVKIVIRDKLFVSNTDNNYVLYVRQLKYQATFTKQSRGPYKNSTALSLIVKTYGEITIQLTDLQNFKICSVSLRYLLL